MGIKNLTGGASLPQIGVLRKGAEKPERGIGRDLKFFRFDTDDEEAFGNFANEYGGEPNSIRVLLPFATLDENFEAWQEEWSASAMQHRCDGETCVLWLDGTEFKRTPKPCPGGCKPVGRLRVIIPEIGRLAYVSVLTHSKHDIMSIDSSLRALQNGRGSLTGIPLTLRRRDREISTPRDGKRVRVTKSLITIEAQAEWAAVQMRALQASSMPLIEAPHQYHEMLQLKPMDDDEDDDGPVLRKPETMPEPKQLDPVVELAKAKHDLARAKSALLKENATKRIEKFEKEIAKAAPVAEEEGEPMVTAEQLKGLNAEMAKYGFKNPGECRVKVMKLMGWTASRALDSLSVLEAELLLNRIIDDLSVEK
jgi:hypothetical protein